jgi:hypothetical protein
MLIIVLLYNFSKKTDMINIPSKDFLVIFQYHINIVEGYVSKHI